jgi:hypothetical protein
MKVPLFLFVLISTSCLSKRATALVAGGVDCVIRHKHLVPIPASATQMTLHMCSIPSFAWLARSLLSLLFLIKGMSVWW